MFCKYCGASIAEDSVFCAKCGRRLGRAGYPRLEKAVATLRLKTPYPYFAVLVVLFAIWTSRPRQSGVDYSAVKMTLELDQKLDLPEEQTYKQAMSLIVENTGESTLRDIPVEIRASIEPTQRAEVLATFLGRQLLIMQSGRPLPLIVVLADAVEPGTKRRYFLEGSVQAEPPFKLTYEVREEDAGGLLASYVVEP
jgi:hypothetical protein